MKLKSHPFIWGLVALIAISALLAIAGHPLITPESMAGLGMLPLAGSVEDVKDALTKMTTGIEDFKKRHQEEVDKLKSEVNLMQTRAARPGQQVSAPASSELTWTVNGKQARVLRNADEIRSHYETRSRGERESSQGLEDAPTEVRMGGFLRGVAGLGNLESRAVLNTGTDADGGYMVPTTLMSGVLAAMVPESSVLKAGAMMLPLDADSAGAKSFTIAAVDSLPTASWRAENGNVQESSPGFRAVTMTMRSLAFYFKVSREWLADAFGTDDVLNTVIAQAFAKELDRAALRGTGTAPEPRGILNTAGIIAVGNGANGATLQSTKFANMFSAVRQLLEENAPMPSAAIMSPRSRVTLGELVDTTGQPLNTPQLLQPLQLGVTSQIPNDLTVGTSTDCSEMYIGNFASMLIAMRERMSIQKVNEVFATSGQVGFVCHMRADVALLYPKAFAVVTGVR